MISIGEARVATRETDCALQEKQICYRRRKNCYREVDRDAKSVKPYI